MKSDRELLEAAAKAAGMHTTLWAEPGQLLPNKGGWVQFIGGKQTVIFNSLTDDRDAFRLAVALSLQVDCSAHECVVGYGPAKRGFLARTSEVVEKCGVDSLAASRRAITRAAASMKDQTK